MKEEMSKVIQISVLGKISGNVNADEVIGTRVTLKKMYSSGGEVLPFVSARALKYAIRQALKDRGFEIDPFYVDPRATEALRLRDSGRPDKYVDNDLFGYMSTVGRGESALRRQAPIALSYFKAVKDTAIKAEFGARFARPWGEEENPVPFEVEVAEFVGKVNCIIYDYIGDFRQDRKTAENVGGEEARRFLDEVPQMLSNENRKERLRAFLEIFLTPSYVLPRRTNSLNMPEYIASLVALSERGPLPVFQYLNYDFENGKVKVDDLEKMVNRGELKNARFFLIDYLDQVEKLPEEVRRCGVMDVVEESLRFMGYEGVDS